MTLVPLSLRLKDLLEPVTKVKKLVGAAARTVSERARVLRERLERHRRDAPGG